MERENQEIGLFLVMRTIEEKESENCLSAISFYSEIWHSSRFRER